jgi:hypothetical protein
MALARRIPALSLALAACAIAVWAAAPAGATAPHEFYNSSEAHDSNTEACATLNGTAPLRYADFSSTGFNVMPSTGSAECGGGANTILLDKRDLLDTCAGSAPPCGRLYFHRGGVNGSNGSNDKYGHVWIGNLVSGTAPSPTSFRYGHNGEACGASTVPATEGHFRYLVVDMPYEMKYKPGSDASAFKKYADTYYQGSQQSLGIHYGYLTWNWLNNQQNPAANGSYIGGGGVVRSLMRQNQVFHRCDVGALHMNSVTTGGTVNGTVVAVYGKTLQSGQWRYGWIMYSHKYNFSYVDQNTGGVVPPNQTVYHVTNCGC